MKKFKKGFTLVELVIVIAVIAILAAVLIPTFAGIIERSKKSTALQTATSIRDSVFSEDETLYSVNEMKDYIIQYKDSFYRIDENGTLIPYEGTLDECMGTTTYDEGSIVKGFPDSIIYKPVENQGGENNNSQVQNPFAGKQSGLYKNDELIIDWETFATDYADIKSNGSGNTLYSFMYTQNFENDILTIVIDDSITILGTWYENMTRWSSSINVVCIPASVTYIEPGFLSSCWTLYNIFVDENNATYCSDGKALYGLNGVNSAELVSFVNSTTGEKQDFVVPGSVKINGTDYPVLQIANSAFNGNTTIRYITIPDTIEYVANYAFNYCEIERFILESNLHFYTDGFCLYYFNRPIATLKNYEGLTEYTILDSVTYTGGVQEINQIDYDAFVGLNNLQKITIPASITRISENAFSNCSSLTEIVFLTDYANELIIDNHAFDYYNWQDNSKLNTTIYTQTSVVNSAITNYDWANSNRNVTYRTLVSSGLYNKATGESIASWSELKDSTKVVVDAGVLTSFTFETDVNSVLYVDAEVTSIGNNAFLNNNFITEINFYGVVTSIGENAFKNTALNSIYLAPSITSIGASAFEGSDIETVTFFATINTINNSVFKNTDITQIEIPSSVTTINEYAFASTPLTSIIIPTTVTLIKENAFNGCDLLTEISFNHYPDSPITILENAFYLESLVETTILAFSDPNVNTAISGYNWAGSNRQVTFEKRLTSGLYNLKNEQLYTWDELVSENIVNVYYDEYLNKNVLNSITFNDTYYTLVVDDSIGYIVNGFEQTYPTGKLTKIYIPDSVTIDSNPFTNSDALKEIVFSKTNTMYMVDEDNAIYSKNNTFIGLPKSFNKATYTIKSSVNIGGESVNITRLGDSIFGSNSALNTLIVPDSITYCSPYAFNEQLFIENIVVGEHNTAMTVVDGCLYINAYNWNINETCAQLAAVLPESGSNLVLPDTVSFDGTELTVKTITNSSVLRYVDFLESITFPTDMQIFEPILEYNESIEHLYTKPGSTHLYSDNGIAIYSDGSLLRLVPTYKGSYKVVDSYTINETTTPVTRLSSGSLSSRQLTKLVLSSNLEKIEFDAFFRTDSLTSVVIPASVNQIYDCAFQNTTSINELIFLHNTGDQLVIEQNAFMDWNVFTNVTVKVKDTENINPSISGYDWSGSRKNVTFESIGAAGIYSITDDMILPWDSMGSYMGYENFVLTSFTYNDGPFKLVVDSSIKGFDQALFKNNTNLVSITIPYMMTSVNAETFMGCTSLTEINYSENILSVGANAFNGCTSLEEIDIFNAVSIGNYAFSGCTNLKTVNVGTYLETIGNYAFNETDLTSIKFFENLKTIGEGAFYNNINLVDICFMHTSENNLTIGTNAFYVSIEKTTTLKNFKPTHTSISGYDWTASNRLINSAKVFEGGVYDTNFNLLTSWAQLVENHNIDVFEGTLNNFNYYNEGKKYNLVIDESVTSIPNWVLQWSSDVEVVVLPSTITDLGHSFVYYESLRKFYVDGEGGDVYTDGYGLYLQNKLCAFARNSGKTKYEIKSQITVNSGTYNITTINMQVFENAKISTLKIPATITTIEQSALGRMQYLAKIEVESGNTEFYTDGKALYSKNELICYCGKQSSGNYTILSSVTIADTPYTITSIGSSAFASAFNLKQITIPSTITTIKNLAFNNAGITSVVIPDSVTCIANSAFADCFSLGLIEFKHSGSKPITFDTNIFWIYQNTSLTVVVGGNPPSSITNYNYSADNRNVIWQSSVVAGIFDNNGELVDTFANLVQNGTITVSGTTITQVNYTDTLYTLVLDSNITAIGENLFKNNNKLQAIELNNKITTIGNSAFENCVNLTQIFLPDSVTTIGSKAFSGTSISSINFGLNVTTIGTFAFEGTNLSSVTFPQNVELIDANAFTDCTNLTDLTFLHTNDDTLTIGENAFYVASNVDTVVKGIRPFKPAVTNYNFASSNRTVTQSSLYSSGLYNTNGTLAMTWQSLVENVFYVSDTSLLYMKDYAYFNENERYILVIDDSITYIDLYALSPNFSNYTKIVFPRNVIIGGGTIYNNVNLTEFIVDGDSGELYTDGIGLYYQNELVSYAKGNVTSSYTVIESYTNANNVNYNVTKMRDNLFAYAQNIKTVTISKYVSNVTGTFNQCTSITSIIVDENNPYLYTDGQGLYSQNALVGFTSGTTETSYQIKSNVVIDEINYTITTIASNAMTTCTAIRYISMPDTITTIEDNAFFNCYCLESIIIPYNVTSIGGSAFAYCDALTSIRIHCSNPEEFSIGEYVFSTGNSTPLTVYVPVNFYTIFANYNWTNDNRNNVEIKHLSDPALYNPSTTATRYGTWDELIASGAITVSGTTFVSFNYTDNDVYFVMSDTITTIASNAFKDKTNIVSIELPFNLTSIGDSAFEGCTGIIAPVYVPDSAKGNIGTDAFKDVLNVENLD